jgi:hypothetical protein
MGVRIALFGSYLGPVTFKRLLIAASVLLVAAAFGAPSPVGATHTWGSYHWARQANPFTLSLADNVSTQWDASLQLASSDWTQSSVLNTNVVAGRNNPKTCKPVTGRVEVCNAKYGSTGWLGIAQIWASGSHITQGVVKLNDTYFNTAAYNTPEWRNFVTCQEVGHAFGLGHQDENFDNANLGSCMDYTSNPASNQHPNQHDFDLLESIYSHTDTTTTVRASSTSSASSGAGNAQNDWGKAIGGHPAGGADGHHHNDVFVKDLGKGHVVLTHVFWAAHSH